MKLFFVHDPNNSFSVNVKLIIDTMTLSGYPFEITNAEKVMELYSKQLKNQNIKSPYILFVQNDKTIRAIPPNILSGGYGILNLYPGMMNCTDFPDFVIQMVLELIGQCDLPHRLNDEKKSKAKENRTLRPEFV